MTVGFLYSYITDFDPLDGIYYVKCGYTKSSRPITYIRKELKTHMKLEIFKIYRVPSASRYEKMIFEFLMQFTTDPKHELYRVPDMKKIQDAFDFVISIIKQLRGDHCVTEITVSPEDRLLTHSFCDPLPYPSDKKGAMDTRTRELIRRLSSIDNNQYAREIAGNLQQALDRAMEKTNNIIPFVGKSGGGKSTLLNCLLGENILPSSVGAACTSTAIVIEFGSSYAVIMEYISPQEWIDIVEYLCECMNDESMSREAQTEIVDFHRHFGFRERHESLQATLKTIHCTDDHHTQEGLIEDLKQQLMRLEEWPGLEGKLDTCEPTLVETNNQASTTIKRKINNCLDVKRGIVKKIVVRVPSPWLRDNKLSLVDLPGTQDTSLLRRRIHDWYLQSADHVVVVTPAMRVLTDPTTHEFLERRGKLVRDGRYSGSGMSFVISKTDELKDCDDDDDMESRRIRLVGDYRKILQRNFDMPDIDVSVFAAARDYDRGTQRIRDFLRDISSRITLERYACILDLIVAARDKMKWFSDPDITTASSMRRIKAVCKFMQREIQAYPFPTATNLNTLIMEHMPLCEPFDVDILLGVHVSRLRKMMKEEGEWPPHLNTLLSDHYFCNVDPITKEWHRVFVLGVNQVLQDFPKFVVTKLRNFLDSDVPVPHHIESQLRAKIRGALDDVKGRHSEITREAKLVVRKHMKPYYKLAREEIGSGTRKRMTNIIREGVKDCMEHTMYDLTEEIEWCVSMYHNCAKKANEEIETFLNDMRYADGIESRHVREVLDILSEYEVKL